MCICIPCLILMSSLLQSQKGFTKHLIEVCAPIYIGYFNLVSIDGVEDGTATHQKLFLRKHLRRKQQYRAGLQRKGLTICTRICIPCLLSQKCLIKHLREVCAQVPYILILRAYFCYLGPGVIYEK